MSQKTNLKLIYFLVFSLFNISCGDKFNLASQSEKSSKEYREQLVKLGEAQEEYRKAKQDWLQAQRSSQKDKYEEAHKDWEEAQDKYNDALDDYSAVLSN